MTQRLRLKQAVYVGGKSYSSHEIILVMLRVGPREWNVRVTVQGTSTSNYKESRAYTTKLELNVESVRRAKAQALQYATVKAAEYLVTPADRIRPFTSVVWIDDSD